MTRGGRRAPPLAVAAFDQGRLRDYTSLRPASAGFIFDTSGLAAMRQRSVPEAVLDFRLRLRRKWLRWGLLPVLALALLGVGASAVFAAPDEPMGRAAELRLQFAMALAAAAFLAGFWTEGYLTSVDKILAKVARAKGKKFRELTREDIQSAAGMVEEILERAHWDAIILGWMVGAAVIVGALAGMPWKHCLVVVLVAVLYELYLFSRHWHASEVMASTLSGDLFYDARVLAAQQDFKPTPWQRVAMFFGWRPDFSAQVDMDDTGRRHKARRRK